MKGKFLLSLLLGLSLLLTPTVLAGEVEEVYRGFGVAMHGDLKYGLEDEHFDHVNPNAPKGGIVRLATRVSFDSWNPFTLKGTSAPGAGMAFSQLMEQSDDEPFSMYGYVAEEIAFPEDRSWVEFKIRPEARFHDGSPITPEDVIFSMNILKEKGHPFYSQYYGDVKEGIKIDEHTVRFVFSQKDNAELPLIVAQLTILSKDYWEGRDFSKSTDEPIMGSGPYKVKEFEMGRYAIYELVEDWWAKDLFVNKGKYNFGIHYKIYLDETALLVAFKAGEYDYRYESMSKQWNAGYDCPAFREGRFAKVEIEHERPAGMQAFVFNTRKPVFQDPEVRKAVAYAFDFEWINKTLMYDAYARTRSYYANSSLASSGLPSPEELEILEQFRGRIPDEVFTEEYASPSTDGSGRNRQNMRTALRIFKKAGWELNADKKLAHKETGLVMEFEILLYSPSFERIVLAFVDQLKKLGISVNVRLVDPSTYQNRVDEFDYDMVISTFGQSDSPGNEQRDFWGSYVANVRGSRNLIGIEDPVVDELIEMLIKAKTRTELETITKCLDRILLWGHYVIPQWHHNKDRIAYWTFLERPEVTPKYGTSLFSWWVDAEKAEEIQGK